MAISHHEQRNQELRRLDYVKRIDLPAGAALGPEMAWTVVPEIAMFAAVAPAANGDPAISLSDPSVGLT